MSDRKLGPPSVGVEIISEALPWLIGIGGFVLSFAATEYVSELNRQAAMFAVVFGILSYMSTTQLLRIFRFRRIDHALKDIRDEQDKINKYGKSEHEIIEQLLNLLHADHVLRETGFDALQRAFKGLAIKGEEPFIKVSGTEITYASYGFFWSRMLGLQQELRKQRSVRGRKIHMIARLTHSSNVEEWGRSDLLIDIKKIHGDFTKAGGEVFRIFLDNEQTEKKSNYIATMREMIEARVKCVYLHRRFAPVVKPADFASDFCIIEPHQYSSDWFNASGQQPVSCEIGRRPSIYLRNMDSWDRLIGALNQYRYDVGQGLTQEQVDFFSKCRAFFLGLDNSLTTSQLVATADICLRMVGDEAA